MEQCAHENRKDSGMGRFLKTVTGVITIAAAAFSSPSQRIESEAMQTSGSAGTIAGGVPFSGVRFYANNDRASASVSLPAVPGRYRFIVRGASTSSAAAGLSLYLDNTRAGGLSFTGQTPSLCTLTVDVSAAPSTLALVLETDNGSNDTDADYVDISHAGEIPPPPARNAPPRGECRPVQRHKKHVQRHP